MSDDRGNLVAGIIIALVAVWAFVIVDMAWLGVAGVIASIQRFWYAYRLRVPTVDPQNQEP
ncbi:hypothetical protein BH09ACT10_BH09ACT10_26230 [soil metagenome]